MVSDYKTRAVVLHSVRYGDSGYVVYMYLELLGRVTYYVNGNRSGRPTIGRSKVSLEPLSVLEIIGYPSSRGSMHRIREAKNLFTGVNFSLDIRKASIAMFITEALYRIVRDNEPNTLLFDYIVQSVGRLNNTNNGIANFHLYFLVHLCGYLGFSPSDNYMEDSFFDIKRGEFVVIKPTHDFFVDQPSSSVLNAIINCDINNLDNVKMNRTTRVYLLSSIISFLSYHHDTNYKIDSLEVLSELF